MSSYRSPTCSGRSRRSGCPWTRHARGIGEEIIARIEELEARIYEDVGHPFNIGSPKQLGEVLFEEMGIPPLRKTKTGYSTDAKVLQQLAIGTPHSGADHRVPRVTKLQGHVHRGAA